MGYTAQPAIEYFKHWSHGTIESHMRRFIQSHSGTHHMSLGQEDMTTTDQVVEFLHMHRLRACPAVAKASRDTSWNLHDAWRDERNMEHFVLRSARGSLQYYVK